MDAETITYAIAIQNTDSLSVQVHTARIIKYKCRYYAEIVFRPSKRVLPLYSRTRIDAQINKHNCLVFKNGNKCLRFDTQWSGDLGTFYLFANFEDAYQYLIQKEHYIMDKIRRQKVKDKKEGIIDVYTSWKIVFRGNVYNKWLTGYSRYDRCVNAFQNMMDIYRHNISGTFCKAITNVNIKRLRKSPKRFAYLSHTEVFLFVNILTVCIFAIVLGLLRKTYAVEILIIDNFTTSNIITFASVIFAIINIMIVADIVQTTKKIKKIIKFPE